MQKEGKLLGVQTLYSTLLPVQRTLVSQTYGRLNVGDHRRILITPKTARTFLGLTLVEVQPLQASPKNVLHTGTTRFHPIGTNTQRPVLPIDTETNPRRMPTSRVPVDLNILSNDQAVHPRYFKSHDESPHSVAAAYSMQKLGAQSTTRTNIMSYPKARNTTAHIFLT